MADPVVVVKGPKTGLRLDVEVRLTHMKVILDPADPKSGQSDKIVREIKLSGPLDDEMRHVLDAVRRCGRVVTSDLVKEVDQPASTLKTSLDGLLARRLVMREDDAYVSLQSVM